MAEQQTFGPVVGMEPVVPTRKHYDDLVECSDGNKVLHGEAFYDCRNNPHSTEEDRDEADVTIVEEILDGVDKWVTEYTTENTDYADGYAHIVCETRHDWDHYVGEWVEDNYPDYSGDLFHRLVSAVCDDLDGEFDCEPEYNRNEYAAYSGDGCCLWGTDIGEYEEQIDIANFPEFVELFDQGRLADILDSVNCDACVGSYSLQRSYPCFETYHCPGGRWHFVVSAERMRQAVTNGIIAICSGKA